jgi:hypothetical protein
MPKSSNRAIPVSLPSDGAALAFFCSGGAASGWGDEETGTTGHWTVPYRDRGTGLPAHLPILDTPPTVFKLGIC